MAAIASQANGGTVNVLLEAVPGVIDYYLDGAAELALEWYEDLRVEANPRRRFTPEPVTNLRLDLVRSQVEQSFAEIQREMERDLDRLVTTFANEAQLMADRLAPVVAEEIANGFRDTITENTKRDPDSVGWRRFARPEACKFCTMLAGRGAVYTEDTARFAAHGATVNGKKRGGDCMCIAGPAFSGEEIWTEATPMQYAASSRERTQAQRDNLRAYLNKNFPDSSG